MKICIDARPLLERRGTGVFEYTRHLLDALFCVSGDQFILYSNSYQYHPYFPDSWKEKNISLLESKVPNKYFNLSQAFLRRPKFNRLIKKLDPKNGNPDLFYFPNLNFASFDKNFPYVVTVHDLSFEVLPHFFSSKQRLWHGLIGTKKMVLGAEKVIAISKHTKNDLINIYGVDPGKISVIYPGLNHLEPGRTLGEIRLRHFLPENFILFLGTVERRKNISGLIRAFEIIAPKIQEYYLILAGSPGPGFGQILAAAKESKVAERIIFLDYVPENERRALYSAAKLFVYPSFYEGFGMPPLEAMSEGIPVVTSLASSLGEVVGDAALMVNPHHINEIAEAMLEGVLNDRLRKSLILRGQSQIKKFDWEKSAKELNDVFQKII